MKVSVALATYNGGRFLLQQLESIAQQSQPPDELVITDDSSSDQTSEIVERFGADAPFPVKFYRNVDRLGPKDNFGRSLSLCSGDLVLLSDQDDVWLPEKIETLVKLTNSNPGHACFLNDAHLTDAALQPTGYTKMQQLRAANLPEESMVMGCCMAIRRSLLDALLPIPESQRSHDNWLVQMADLLDLVVRSPITLQYYRRHGANVSNFFVNRIDRPGLYERLAARVRRFFLRSTSGEGLVGEIADLEDALTRLSERREAFVALVGEARLNDIGNRVAGSLLMLRARRDVRTLSRFRRLAPFYRLLRNGAYEHPGAWKSAAKDLILRNSSRIEKSP